MKLYLAYCSFASAKFATENWHYSRSMPSGKLIKIGIWEDDKFTGCIIFGRGANNNIGKPYSLGQTEVCELVRVALRNHSAPVTRIVSIAINILKRNSPAIRLIVSYADTKQGHVGTIYQAGNWIYTGTTCGQSVMINGVVEHRRTVFSRLGSCKGLKFVKDKPKHKYLMPLDSEIRKSVSLLSKPYPETRQKHCDDATSTRRGGRFNSDPVAPNQNIDTKCQHAKP